MIEKWRPVDNHDVEWIDVGEPKFEDLMLLASEYGLHQHTVLDCLEPGHLPKFERVEDTGFIIVRKHAPNDQYADTIQELTNKVAIFFNDKFIITIHRQPQVFLYELKHKYIVQGACKSTRFMVLKILEATLHSYLKPGDDLEHEIDHYESQIFLEKSIPNLQKNLYYLKRKAGISKKMIALTEEVIRLIEAEYENSPELEEVWDIHTKVETLYDRVLEDAHNLTNVYLAISAQRTNEVMRTLTIFSIFFMPLTFIAGIYGMNFDWMPELRVWWGYPAVWVLMVATSVGIYGWLRWKKWL
jgi:magnesium transporter